MAELSIVIQAGGQSSRMGEDKGLIKFGEITMVEYILAQVKDIGQELLVISNQPKDYRFLELPVYMDALPGIGALGGLYTALAYAQRDLVLVLACDMPFVNLDLIDYMISLSSNHEVVVPVLGEKRFAEPFRAVYARDALPAVERAIHNGRRRAISFYDDLRVREVDQEEIDRLDPAGLSFVNINTPEDYQKTLQMIND